MKLQTKIPILPKQPKIGYASEVLLFGSCFAENIGDKFEYFKFKNAINPIGILFHPKAIENFLWMSTQGEQYTPADVFFHNEQWHCFDAHSSMSNTDQNELLADLNDALFFTNAKIKTSTHIFITLGTSWVYRLKALDLIVANCHKIPQKEFQKELLSIDEISQSLQNSLYLIRAINPDVQVVFTVSPVRHIKDGYIENNRSKSHLLASIHQVVDDNEYTSYLPSYEIVMDELRDYRFYDLDMIHPNELAIACIWQYVSETWISETAIDIMKRVEEIQKGLSHRPFNPNSEQYQTFLRRLEAKKQQLQAEYNFIVF
ncbi:GSCFA domain-containing protein [Aquimarina algicola]|uniref:GSCFA domain-containing protein n=1 Tax=Aquimarina algicola TaxID=2589995 RepID=A0A504J7F2_9FLAO|nr:GSCFA domain-containing protein [Aquimarina algicola]TPN86747.1 GSCFA domain-containing protein [Aquimarina algicola]